MKQLVNVSSMPWLPAIDSSWDVVRADHFLSVKKTVVGEKWPDYTLLSLTKAGVVIRDFTDRQGKLPETFDSYQEVQIGDLVMCLFDMDETPRTVGISSHRGMITGAYTTFQFDQTIVVPRYFEYLFISIDDRKAFKAAYSGLRKTIRPPVFLSLRFPLPPLETQQRIADYLDRETAEIDAAVADLDKYVELLEQSRLFTVDEVLNSNEAVTSEWTEMSLKFVIRERFVGDWGGEPGTAEVDSVCVRVADFDRPTNTVNDQVPTTRSYSRAKYEAKRLQHHDILVERSGGGDKTPVGSAMLYTGGDEALCANFIEVVRLKEDQLPEYWVHILRREYMGRNTMRFVKQTTGIQNLDPQSFYDQKFPVPSLNEQHSLAEELRQRTSEIDSLIADATRLRDLLLKRRSVLITEVVTGRKQV